MNTVFKTLKADSTSDHVDIRWDIQTVRRRVDKIRSSWTSQERQARAIEGRLRRAELARLLNDCGASIR